MATIVFQEGSDAHNPILQKKQLLNNLVDGMAHARPNALYAEFPRSTTSYDEGFYKITYAALANAINGVAWWLDRELGPGTKFETLTYIGPSDFRHNIMLLGAVKAGYQMLLVSPRNNIPAYTNLFDSTGCKVVLAAEPLLPVTSDILTARPMRLLRAPSVEELLGTKFAHYPFTKTFEAARNEPLVLLHTSGTTSLPKPIVYTHEWAASYISATQVEPPSGFQSQDKEWQGNRLFVMLPPFHAGNLFATLLAAIPNQTVLIYPLSGVVPTAQVVIDGLKRTHADVAMLTPPMVEEIAKNPAQLDFVSRNLDSIFYVGGDVSQELGDVLTSKLKFFNHNGSTEMGSYPLLRQEGEWATEDWKYIMPHPAAGLEFRHRFDNVYEAYVVRNSNVDEEQPIFKMHPELREYRVGDLFSPHPSKPGLWAYRARADDMIVFLNGAKIDPIAMEQHVASYPEVRTALMAGTGRLQAALLIELVAADHVLSPFERAQTIDRLWPTIQDINRIYQTDSRITKSHVLFTHPWKPMLRAGKGTVQRAPTIQLYATELNELYDAAEKSSASMPADVHPPDRVVHLNSS